MTLSTYTEFTSDIADWLDRSNLPANAIPNFIKLAEVRLGRELRVSWLTLICTYTVLSVDDIDFELPARFNGVRSLRVNSNPLQSLRYVTPENLNEGNFENLASPSRFFTIVGNRLRVVPPPREDDVLQLVLYQTPKPLASMTQETNLFTENCPDSLLYASLLEAKPYVKDEKRIKVWSELYEESVKKIKEQDEALRWGEHSLEPMAPYSADPLGRTATG